MNNYSWIEVIGGSTLFGAVTASIGWLLGGRKKQSQELKSSEIDNEIKEVDYAGKVRDFYESLLVKRDSEIKYLLDQAKEDRDYFRTEMSPLREELTALRLKVSEQDKQIAELSLINAITKEAADSWEQKFNELQKEHDALKRAFDNLKKSMK